VRRNQKEMAYKRFLQRRGEEGIEDKVATYHDWLRLVDAMKGIGENPYF
jgi:hypothetical protein